MKSFHLLFVEPLTGRVVSANSTITSSELSAMALRLLVPTSIAGLVTRMYCRKLRVSTPNSSGPVLTLQVAKMVSAYFQSTLVPAECSELFASSAVIGY